MSAYCCPACSRQFGDHNAMRQHHNMKHKKRAPVARQMPEDAEPSMAELVVQAHLDRAMGNTVEDWIVEMFDV